MITERHVEPGRPCGLPAESFAAALRSFGAMVTRVDLLAAISAGDEAMLLYDRAAGLAGEDQQARSVTGGQAP